MTEAFLYGSLVGFAFGVLFTGLVVVLAALQGAETNGAPVNDSGSPTRAAAVPPSPDAARVLHEGRRE